MREIQKISQEPVSLENPVGDEGDSQLGDFIEDEQSVAPSDAVGELMQGEDLGRVLELLTSRERRVLEMRYGLTDGRPHTLEEVGVQFGVTRERIRQIEAKTLAKLRAYREAQEPARLRRVRLVTAGRARRPWSPGSRTAPVCRPAGASPILCRPERSSVAQW